VLDAPLVVLEPLHEATVVQLGARAVHGDEW